MKKKTLLDRIIEYQINKYGSRPEYLWKDTPDCAIFRHSENRKWFSLFMTVSYSKFGLDGDAVDVLNLKTGDPVFTDFIIEEPGIFRAYHMNKREWISVLLDGSVPEDEIYALIDRSFAVTAPKRRKKKIREPKEWIVPANPKYFDIVHAFDSTDEIDWKQGAGINRGDTVFVYVGAPVSAILYKCTVTETDIPFNYSDGNLKITSLMKLKLKDRYDPTSFTFERLKNEYGIYAVRGPRGVTYSLSFALNNK
ncbi:MAG: MmcQ/YjbR family DNA-binding protein [Clostridia bacterium]|nr:MmcQ/YjbR family DNA-binding protein [Clostridia bacterium]